MGRIKSSQYIIATVVTLVAVVIFFATATLHMSVNSTMIDRNGTIAGIKFNDEELNALPDESLIKEKLISELLCREQDLFILVKIDDTEYPIPLLDLRIYYGIDNACRKFTRGGQSHITVDVMKTEETDNEIMSLLGKLGIKDVEVVNAGFEFEGGFPVPRLGNDGISYNWVGILDAIYEVADITVNQNILQPEIELDGFRTVVAQDISNEDIWQYVDVIGEATTKYSEGSTNRNHNMEFACEKLTGAIIMPGRIFSMYNQASPFTIEEGYLTAGSLKDGLANEAIGGGVCQVTTTLYNAVIRAELDVTQRYNHSLKPAYVAPAFDATISSANVDFKFRNNTSGPVFLYAMAADGIITVRVYGHETRDPDRKIRFDNRYDSNANKYYLDKSIYIEQELVTIISINESVYKD